MADVQVASLGLRQVKRIAWTGHRPYYFRYPVAVERRVAELAAALRDEFGDVEFLVGGQRGVDAWAASAAISMGVPYHLVLPVPIALFTVDWDPEDVVVLRRLWDAAASGRVVDECGHLGAGAYDRRNDVLVSEADLVVAVWTGIPAGGTYYTICRAREMGKPIREVIVEGSGRPVQWGQRGL